MNFGCNTLFYQGILHKNYRKMTIKWLFSYNSFVKVSLYHDALIMGSIPMDTKHSIIKGWTVLISVIENFYEIW